MPPMKQKEISSHLQHADYNDRQFWVHKLLLAEPRRSDESKKTNAPQVLESLER